MVDLESTLHIYRGGVSKRERAHSKCQEDISIDGKNTICSIEWTRLGAVRKGSLDADEFFFFF